MTTIVPGAQIVTAINVISVEPNKQTRVVELLCRASDLLGKTQPGFISANIHRGLDGTKVVNYVQWRSKEAFESVFGNKDFMQLYSEIKELSRPEPSTYEVVHTVQGSR